MILAGMDSLHDEAIQYKNMLEKADVEVELHDFKDSIHGFIRLNKADAKEAYGKMIDFMDRHK